MWMQELSRRGKSRMRSKPVIPIIPIMHIMSLKPLKPLKRSL